MTMHVIPVILLFIFITNFSIALAVVFANHRRAQNRQFFLFSMTLNSWVLCVLGVVLSRNAVTAEWMIRLASCFGVFIPPSFLLLCMAIKSPEESLGKRLFRARWMLLLGALVGMLCFTSFFLTGVRMPAADHSVLEVPQALYGKGFLLFIVYLPLALGFTIFYFIRLILTSDGVQRAEIQFTLMGMISALPIAVAVHLMAVVTGNSAVQQFGPLCLIPMTLILAYGVATRRLMGVAAFLQRLVAYSLLAVYLAAVYFAVLTVSRFVLLGIFPNTPTGIIYWLATLAMVFAYVPAQRFMEKVAQRLFFAVTFTNMHKTIQQANLLLQGISTLDELLRQFHMLIAQAFHNDKNLILLRQAEGFAQRYSDSAPASLLAMNATSAIVKLLEATHEPVVADVLQRRAPSPLSDQALRQLAELKINMAVGIYLKNQVAGILLLGPPDSKKMYDRLEQDTLQIICNELAVAIENAKLYTEVQNSKIYNETLLDQLTSGVIAINAAHTITVFNREARRLTRLTSAAVLNHPATLLPAPLTNALLRTLETRAGLRDMDVQLEAEGMDPIVVRLTSSIFIAEDGAVLGALLVMRDQTILRRLEDQIRRNDRLASAGTLAAGMAHEIKNPLVTLKTFAQLLPERYDDPDFRQTFSSLIGKEVIRIDSIVNQLLKFTRPVKPKLYPLQLHSTIAHVHKLVDQSLKQNGVALKQELTADGDWIMGDSDLLVQALLNFYLNAVDAMEKGGVITVRTEVVRIASAMRDLLGAPITEPFIRVSIQDNGSGIPEADLPHIFDPFFTTKAKGTGLGLSVSYNIVQEHGGTVEVKSRPGLGTVFFLMFPLTTAEAAA